VITALGVVIQSRSFLLCFDAAPLMQTRPFFSAIKPLHRPHFSQQHLFS